MPNKTSEQLRMRRKRIAHTIQINPDMTAAQIARKYSCQTPLVREVAEEMGIELKAHEHLTNKSYRRR